MSQNESFQMEDLTAAFYAVMYQYQMPFMPAGVEANLCAWRENKLPLVEILRRHPNWNERELAIVFDLSEGRGIEHSCVDENKFGMYLLAQDAGLDGKGLEDFMAALDAATADYAAVPNADRLNTIRERGHIKCAEGQKASRIINRLCLHFGLDKYEVDKVSSDDTGIQVTKRIRPYNAVFARLADSLNPVQIPKTGVLSVHPCDFLEMSSQKNAWRSCHRLNGGSYRGGCQSYMGDRTSMIFFTVDNDVKKDFYCASRLTRQVFCYQEGLLLQSRLYPNNDDEIRKLYRSLVQQALSLCLGRPNLWKTSVDQPAIRKRLHTAEGALHYPDYNHDYAVLSSLKDMQNDRSISIGSRSLCTCCGRPQENHWELKCDDCVPMAVCADCGQTVSIDRGHYEDEAFYCNECMGRCGNCRGIMRKSRLRHAVSKNGLGIQLCEDCFERLMRPCQNCGIRNICQMIGGGQFCPNADFMLDVA